MYNAQETETQNNTTVLIVIRDLRREELYRVNSKYVTILKPQDLQEVNKPKMWLNILNS
jgi:hypothetical protein